MENISANPSNENILFPIDLSIFKEHVKLSFESILDTVNNCLIISCQQHKKLW